MKSIIHSANILAAAAVLGLPAVSQADPSVTVTNLPEIALSGFQVSGLNNAGDLTGFFFVAFEHPQHAFSYTNNSFTDLGTLGGDTGQGNAINSLGQIVGESEPNGSLTAHAFFYDGTNMTDLQTLGGSYSSAGLINDSSQVAGTSLTDGDGECHAFFYSGGSMLDLHTLGGSYSAPAALNSSGQVAGSSTLANNATHAFLYTGGAMNDLGTLGGTYSAAFGLNNSGAVVGESTINDSVIHPFLWANGVMTDLQGFGGSYATAMALNDAGQVLGLSSLPGDAVYHGFVFANSHLTDLGTLGGDNTFPYAQNSLGQVVGQSDTATDGPHAFIWQNGAISDLNDLLPAESGWTLQFATLINNAGRIVGVGDHNGVSEWFILDVTSGNQNRPPVAVAGVDQVVNCQTPVTLDGSHSSDPDGDALTFAWTSAGFLLGTNSTLTGSFALGTNVVTLTVTDPSGASSSAHVTVTVIDTNAPTITVLSGVTVSVGVNCTAVMPVIRSQVSLSDNCTPAESITLSQSPAAGTTLDLGQHVVTVTATDLAGNSASATLLVTVADTTAPVIVSGPAVPPIPAGPNCQGVTPDVTSSIQATDNCTAAAGLVITQSPAAGTPAAVGTHSIIVTVKDAAGNATSGLLDFKVVDVTAPVFVSGPASVNVSVDGSCQAVVPDLHNSFAAADNCTLGNLIVIGQIPAAGTPVSKGTYSITVTATDAAGNTSSRPVILNVVDTTAPVITSVPSSMNVSVGANCQGVVPNVLGSVVAADNCTPTSQLVLSQSPAAGTALTKGAYPLTITVADADGNVSTRQLLLNVVDTTAPVISSVSASPNTISSPNNKMVPVTVSVSATDNCDAPVSQIVSITCNESVAPSAMQITGALTASLLADRDPKGTGRVYTITVRSSDSSGNSSTATVTVTVPKGGK